MNYLGVFFFCLSSWFEGKIHIFTFSPLKWLFANHIHLEPVIMTKGNYEKLGILTVWLIFYTDIYIKYFTYIWLIFAIC